MLGNQYYNQVLRKYVIMFGNLFNDIVVQRLNNDGTRIQAIAVPIAYGPREKFLARLRANPNLADDTALQLPRMSFEITGMTYAPQRKLNRQQMMVGSGTSASTLTTNQASAPYDIDFSLSIYVKNADDGVQITENILPYFTPEFTATMRLLEDMPDFLLDIPVVLQNISMEDTYEGDFETRRAIVYTLNFVVKGHIFGAIKQKGVITRVQVDAYTDLTTAAGFERTVVTPGQFANGIPTTNSAASVARSAISANSDFGIAEEFFTFASSGSDSTNVTLADFNAYIANTNPRFDKYLEVANVASLVSGVSNADFQSYIANTNPRIFVFNANGQISDHLIPSANITFDLGSEERSFRDLYLSGNTIFIANNRISTDGNTISFVTDTGENAKIEAGAVTIKDILGNALNDIILKASNGSFKTVSASDETQDLVTKFEDLEVPGTATIAELVLTNVLGTQYGGTGLSSVTQDGILVGKSSSELEYITGTVGKLLQVSSNGTPTFDDLDGGTYS